MNKNVALDTVEIVAKTALSVIPVGGALATAVYDAVKGNCLAKRQEEWKRALEERLSPLRKRLKTSATMSYLLLRLLKEPN